MMIPILATSVLWGQSGGLTINQAVEQSVIKYPAVQVSLEQVSAAAARIGLARTSFLPRADFAAQVNRATHNNVFGLLFPQSVISPISGPVQGTNTLGNVWGTAVGVLVSWEPFDFGLRRANIEVAQVGRERASAQVNVTKFQVAWAAADEFVTILAAEQTVKAAQAGVERARAIYRVVETLVRNDLRPGADQSRSRAEQALAENQLIQARQNVELARAALGQLLGASPSALDAGKLGAAPPDPPTTEPALNAHSNPLLVAQQDAIDEIKARQRALDRSYYPKFNLQGTSYSRGTGIQANGDTGGPVSGLGPNIQNWGVGMTVMFPSLDLPGIRIRKEIEAHTERAESARYGQLKQDLNAQLKKAKATLDAARQIAKNTPIQLASARDAEQQAMARYKAGLTNIVEVAEAERLLTQAEIDDSLARLGIWRSLLAVAIALGDLQPFLEQAAK